MCWLLVARTKDSICRMWKRAGLSIGRCVACSIEDSGLKKRKHYETGFRNCTKQRRAFLCITYTFKSNPPSNKIWYINSLGFASEGA
jgi:hypothetical protein